MPLIHTRVAILPIHPLIFTDTTLAVLMFGLLCWHRISGIDCCYVCDVFGRPLYRWWGLYFVIGYCGKPCPLIPMNAQATALPVRYRNMPRAFAAVICSLMRVATPVVWYDVAFSTDDLSDTLPVFICCIFTSTRCYSFRAWSRMSYPFTDITTAARAHDVTLCLPVRHSLTSPVCSTRPPCLLILWTSRDTWLSLYTSRRVAKTPAPLPFHLLLFLLKR